jgi:hypothetical protein
VGIEGQGKAEGQEPGRDTRTTAFPLLLLGAIPDQGHPGAGLNNGVLT